MTIDAIRNHINDNLGKEVVVFYNEGRNKIFKYKGKVLEVYDNVFIILDNEYKRSFSYYDILTNTINISFKM